MVVETALITFRKSSNILVGWNRGGRGNRGDDGMDNHSLMLLGWVLSGLPFLLVPKLPLVATFFWFLGYRGYNALTNSLVDQSLFHVFGTVEGARVGIYNHPLDLRG